jgi:hypothetical protein
MTASGAMGNAHRLVGYLASFSSASLFYLVWFAVQNRTSASHVTVLFQIGFALFFWLFGGMAAALVLMAFPWYLAVLWHGRLQRSGLGEFSRTPLLELP